MNVISDECWMLTISGVMNNISHDMCAAWWILFMCSVWTFDLIVLCWCGRSEYGQAFEPHYQRDGSSADREDSSEKNSFFVTAIKDVLNTQANSESESISDFLRNVQKSKFCAPFKSIHCVNLSSWCNWL